MARIEYTAVVSSIRGKLNGNVFTRNKGGEVLRNKVTPINPNTSAQSTQRAYQSDISKAWNGVLTDAQRKSWNDFGRVLGAKSIFGNNLILSGIAAYIKVNRIILNCGQPRIDNAPVSQQVPSILSLVLAGNSVGPTLTATFTPTPLTGTTGLYVFMSPAVSPGISNLSNQLRFVGFFSAATSPLNLLTAWQTKFGSFPTTAGQRIGMTAQVVDTATGAISAVNGTGTLVL